MSHPLRLLHVVPYYEHAWAYGGIPRLATAMTRALARRGHAVDVCTTDACDDHTRTGKTATPDAHGVSVRVFPNLSNRLAYHLQLFTPVGLRAHLRTHAGDYDVAHLHACHNLPVALAARALLRARVPYVLSPNGTAPLIERRIAAKRLFDATIGRGVLAHAARVIAVSDAERRQLLTLGVPETAIAIVPNPVDEREFEAGPDPRAFRVRHGVGDAPLVLFLGKLTPRKGVDVLLHAFQQIRCAEARLIVAGNDMGSGRAVDALIDILDLSLRAQRIGLLCGAERLDALAAANVVVYPSRDEIFGLVPLEALLCGSPVVVSGDSGCGEVIGRTGGGHIVPYGDAAALAGAIDSVLDARELWRSRARRAADRVRDLYAADNVAAQLEQVYLDVVRAHAVGAVRTNSRGACSQSTAAPGIS